MFQRKIPNNINHASRRFHYTRKNGKWKPKKDFDTKEDAEVWIKKYKMKDYCTYLCPECGKWHIGRKKS